MQGHPRKFHRVVILLLAIPNLIASSELSSVTSKHIYIINVLIIYVCVYSLIVYFTGVYIYMYIYMGSVCHSDFSGEKTRTSSLDCASSRFRLIRFQSL